MSSPILDALDALNTELGDGASIGIIAVNDKAYQRIRKEMEDRALSGVPDTPLGHMRYRDVLITWRDNK